MKFFIGLHHPSTAWPFRNAMISANAIASRKSPFRVNNWILDSGAFSQITKYGRFKISPDQYLDLIGRVAPYGNLLGVVCQDWMCEPFALAQTGLTIQEHQQRTLESYVELSQWTDIHIMAVLQGFEPEDYVRHLSMYGDLLKEGQWVGVGSVCKRNGNPDAIEDVLLAIKSQRPDLKLHGFGLKVQALERATIRELLHSSDSMAWSTAGRRQDGNASDPRRALEYCAKIQDIIGQPTFIQEQLYQWWV